MCVMMKSSLPFSDLALMGLASGSDLSPSLLAKLQSIKLSSAPESISASRSGSERWVVGQLDAEGRVVLPAAAGPPLSQLSILMASAMRASMSSGRSRGMKRSCMGAAGPFRNTS